MTAEPDQSEPALSNDDLLHVCTLLQQHQVTGGKWSGQITGQTTATPSSRRPH